MQSGFKLTCQGTRKDEETAKRERYYKTILVEV